MQYENLPKDVLIEIGLKLSIDDISNYCRLSKNFNRVICDNNDFWIRKLQIDYNMNYLDFNDPTDTHIDTPKEFYERVHKISKLENFYDTYKHTGYNIKLVDYYLEIGGGIDDVIEQVSQLPDTTSAIKLIDHLLKRGADIAIAMYGAAKSNNEYLIEYLESKGAQNDHSLSMGGRGAAFSNNGELLNKFIKKGATEWREFTYGAAEGGQERMLAILLKGYLGNQFNQLLLTTEQVTMTNIINFAALNGRENILSWFIIFKENPRSSLFPAELTGPLSNIALMGAAIKNNKSLIKKLLENGATEYNMGLNGASYGGRIELIKYFISLGAADYTHSFGFASSTGNKKTAEYLWNVGNVDINDISVISEIIDKKNKPMLLYIIGKGFNNWNLGIDLARNANQGELLKILEMGRNNRL